MSTPQVQLEFLCIINIMLLHLSFTSMRKNSRYNDRMLKFLCLFVALKAGKKNVGCKIFILFHKISSKMQDIPLPKENTLKDDY